MKKLVVFGLLAAVMISFSGVAYAGLRQLSLAATSPANLIVRYYDIAAIIRVEGLPGLPLPRTIRTLKITNLSLGQSAQSEVGNLTWVNVPSGCNYLVEATVVFLCIGGGTARQSAIITGLDRDIDVPFTFNVPRP